MSEPIPLWEDWRFWQIVVTGALAFLGFTVGTWIKHRFDLRADRLRRETDRRFLETALRAELLGLEQEGRSRIKQYEKLLNENPVKEVFGGPQNFAHLALPPRRVWMAHLGRIGELKGVDTDALVLVHSFFDSYDLAVETFR